MDFIHRQDDLCEEIRKSLEDRLAMFYAPIILAPSGTLTQDSLEGIPLEWSAMTTTKLNKVNGDKLARSFLLQGLPNEIYTSVDSHKTAKAMWDEIAKHAATIGHEFQIKND